MEAPARDDYLGLFYNNSVLDRLLSIVKVPPKPEDNDEDRAACLYAKGAIFNIFGICIQYHAARAKYRIMQTNLPISLLEAVLSFEPFDSLLAIQAVKLFKTFINSKEEFYVRRLVMHDAMKPIFRILQCHVTRPRSNGEGSALESCILDVFGLILRLSGDPVTGKLLQYVSTKYFNELVTLNHYFSNVCNFHIFGQILYAASTRNALGFGRTSALGGMLPDGATRRFDLSLADEDAYFDTDSSYGDEDDDNDTLTRDSSRQEDSDERFFRSGLKLVEYDDDEDVPSVLRSPSNQYRKNSSGIRSDALSRSSAVTNPRPSSLQDRFISATTINRGTAEASEGSSPLKVLDTVSENLRLTSASSSAASRKVGSPEPPSFTIQSQSCLATTPSQGGLRSQPETPDSQHVSQHVSENIITPKFGSAKAKPPNSPYSQKTASAITFSDSRLQKTQSSRETPSKSPPGPRDLSAIFSDDIETIDDWSAPVKLSSPQGRRIGDSPTVGTSDGGIGTLGFSPPENSRSTPASLKRSLSDMSSSGPTSPLPTSSVVFPSAAEGASEGAATTSQVAKYDGTGMRDSTDLTPVDTEMDGQPSISTTSSFAVNGIANDVDNGLGEGMADDSVTELSDGICHIGKKRKLAFSPKSVTPTSEGDQ